MKCAVLLLSFLIYSNLLHSQPPQIGRSYADLKLVNIVNYSTGTLSLKDLKGKWLILDFWDKHCISCVSSFPRMNALQKKYSDKVQIILVGRQDLENEIGPLFKTFKEKLRLQLACSLDSALCRRFEFNSYPQVLVVDPNGVLREWVGHLDEEKLSGIISNKSEYKKTLPERVPYNRDAPFLVHGNGGDDSSFEFRSLIAEWTPNQRTLEYVDSPVSLKDDISSTVLESGKMDIIGVPLALLFNLAYFGAMQPQHSFGSDAYNRYCNDPVLLTKDSSLFRFSGATNKFLYSYSLMMTKEKMTKTKVMSVMQSSLQNYFDLDARIETMNLPYWALVITKDSTAAKLRTKGGQSSIKGLHANIEMKNVSSETLLNYISWHHQANRESKTFIDETGITSNVDIYMDCVFTDLGDIKKTLQMNGLDLILKQKPTKVLVIYDKN
jgi:thiol-disulfide isomerase/thioredoxin